MKWLRVVIIIMLLASLITMGNAQQTNYAGAAKIVLQIDSPNGKSIESVRTGVYSPYYYSVHVLYSNDSAIKEGGDYKLMINFYDTDHASVGSILPTQIDTGTIIGINDYSFSDNTITVTVYAPYSEENTAWEQKITILNAAGTNSNNPKESTNTDTSAPSTPSSFSSILGTGSSLFNFPTSNFLAGDKENKPAISDGYVEYLAQPIMPSLFTPDTQTYFNSKMKAMPIFNNIIFMPK